MGVAPAEDLNRIKDLACISTSALAVVLSDRVPFDQYKEKRPIERAQLLIRHMGRVMHFATAYDLAKRPAAELVDEDLRFEMRLESEIVKGANRLEPLTSFYDSEEVAGRQRTLRMKHREIKNAPSA